ncbi:DUF6435 family protein [Aliiglaciecola sp. CAU 1673]|uniref:DUF6435 family protein n=1 Tax=Aliiglaciecola sp. CAU 1673 TaxID=3032595 RepID=UPI0023DCC634|nr:DUF6435 family protein [Aliiglaciecola sp. CAU 1673]MDF2177008.1 DUF6435 family protein [Aliiglaciecola sp. CAU 1673]
MFSWFKSDPTKKLRKQYDTLLEQGMQAQRAGNMRLYAELSAKAEALWQQIEKAENDKGYR